MPRKASVLFIGTNRFVAALDSQTGEELWRTKLATSVSGMTLVTLLPRGRVVYAAHAGRVYCLDASSGQVLWENGLPKMGYRPVVLAMEGAAGGQAELAAAVAAAAHAASANAAASGS